MSNLREECGVFGVFSGETNDVASTTYYGLFALQHRGQESCGIVVNDDGVFDRLHNSADTPYNAKELSSEYYACYTRALSGESFVTTEFSGYFGEKTISVPIEVLSSENEYCGVVAVHCPMSNIAATYNSALTFLVVAIVVAAIIAVIISSLLARFVSRPLIEMRNLAQKMAEGDYTVRASDGGKDEIGDLSRSLNYLSDGRRT